MSFINCLEKNAGFGDFARAAGTSMVRGAGAIGTAAKQMGSGIVSGARQAGSGNFGGAAKQVGSAAGNSWGTLTSATNKNVQQMGAAIKR